MGSIRNTAREEVHREWTMGGNPGAIEAQEARGQAQLAVSSQLPTNGLAQAAEALGIEVVGVSAGDNLFSDVRLPEGWRVQPTDHSMWSKLVDATGTERASIFYKAAFYDRSAFIRLS